MVGLDNPLHIALVLVVVLMVFGAKRLPEMGKGLGEGMRGFKQAISGEAPAEPKAQAQPQQHLTQAQETPAAAPAETPARETTPVA